MKNQPSRLMRNFLLMLFSLLVTLAAFGGLAYVYIDSQLPDVQELKSVQLPIPLRVYTNDGQMLAEFGELRRNPISLHQVPPLLVKALLATEDQRFYEHPGVDLFGLTRAAAELLITGTKAQGGSTITMQVARNFYLTRKKTFMRKLTEIMLALKIERELSKDEILELYLNKIYLGNRAYGVAAAAQIYFDKSLNQLTLPEMAVIAGLPKAPSTINPIANPKAAIDRRNHVLARMYDEGAITKKQYEEAINTLLKPTYRNDTLSVNAPYVAEMVRDMMVTSFGDDAYTKGYNVYTTIDSQQQQAANQAVKTALTAYDHRHGYRGPERNLGNINPKHTDAILNKLVQIPTINSLQPAAVINFTDNTVTALLADGNLITIAWKGLSWARPQLKTGNMGPIPKKAGDIVKVGDIIRVQKMGDSNWQLSQIPQAQGALIALNPQNGAINALVGGFDFRLSKFNRVTQAERQPGSSFKPFIYAAGLAKGYTLASIFNNAPLAFNIPGQDALWRPQNDDRSFHGPTRLRVALAKSVNVVSVRLLQAIDVSYALNYLARFGFDSNKLPRNLSLALGTGEVTPLELARGYAVLANGGYKVTPYVVDRITDNQGNSVFQTKPKIACTACNTEDGITTPAGGANSPYAPQVIPTSIAYLMSSAMQDVIRYGTGTAARSLNRSDLSGKTGTTNDQVDTWFSGFNADLVATTWVGFDQPSSLHEYGAQAALPLWIDFMRVALHGKPMHTLAKPADVVSAAIDPVTGALAPEGMPDAMLEYFRKDNLPKAEAAPAAPMTTPAADNGSEPLF